MVRIRLSRFGRRNRSFFRIEVFDQRVRRNGRAIEKLGWYDPFIAEDAKKYSLDVERARHWLSVGAQPSATVRQIFQKQGVFKKEDAAAS